MEAALTQRVCLLNFLRAVSASVSVRVAVPPISYESRRRSGSKLVAIVRDPEHRLLGRFIAYLHGQGP